MINFIYLISPLPSKLFISLTNSPYYTLRLHYTNRAILYYTILHHTILYNNILYYNILVVYYTVLFYVSLIRFPSIIIVPTSIGNRSDGFTTTVVRDAQQWGPHYVLTKFFPFAVFQRNVYHYMPEIVVISLNIPGSLENKLNYITFYRVCHLWALLQLKQSSRNEFIEP